MQSCMLGQAARTSLWHVAGVVIIFACPLRLSFSTCPSPSFANNSISGALQLHRRTSFIMSKPSRLRQRTDKIWIALAPSRFRNHRDYVTEAASLQFIIVKRKLARQMDRYCTLPYSMDATECICFLLGLHKLNNQLAHWFMDMGNWLVIYCRDLETYTLREIIHNLKY